MSMFMFSFNIVSIFIGITTVFIFGIVIFSIIRSFKTQGSVNKIIDESIDEMKEQRKKQIELENNNVEYKILRCPSCGSPLKKDLEACPSCNAALVQVKSKK